MSVWGRGSQSGKSTLFNMLTGMCSSSSGSAAIFGYDINDPDQMAEIRKMTGICPQHDILFDEITPREHLTYFARIRASSRIRTKKQNYFTLRRVLRNTKWVGRWKPS